MHRNVHKELEQNKIAIRIQCIYKQEVKQNLKCIFHTQRVNFLICHPN